MGGLLLGGGGAKGMSPPLKLLGWGGAGPPGPSVPTPMHLEESSSIVRILSSNTFTLVHLSATLSESYVITNPQNANTVYYHYITIMLIILATDMILATDSVAFLLNRQNFGGLCTNVFM